jgi:phosphate starvation-inducible protein PhoH and related proteins
MIHNRFNHSKKKAKNKNKEKISFLEETLRMNAKAVEEGPKKKVWTIHDLKTIYPMTKTQEEMFHVWFQGYNVIASGSPGTGKTFLACFLALNEVLNKRQTSIKIVRSIVPTRDVGFLKGDLAEKVAEYETPYIDIFWELLGKATSYQDMKQYNIVEFVPTSFIRGVTWNDSIIILEECANMTFHEIDSVMTRTGSNSRIIVAGDTKQTDLINSRNKEVEGLSALIRVAELMEEFEHCVFTKEDIVRDKFVKSWITAVEQTKI